MRRPLVWLQILIGWIPMWVVFTTLIVTVHPDTDLVAAAKIALRTIMTAALLGIVVQRLIERFPWPYPFRISFLALHVLGASLFSATWLVLNSFVASVIHRGVVVAAGPGVLPVFVTGVWLYLVVAGVSYATSATERAARAEAAATRSQLAALRSQLNPHFLFNALHTIVQLIPREPRRAAQAAEHLGGLLRDTIDESRDLVSLAEERAFVQRYLDVQRIRFGDRLVVHIDIPDDINETLVPSFALLTLVENAVRHGAEPRAEPTEVLVRATTDNGSLILTVHDSGTGDASYPSESPAGNSNGTGLKRLRERLAVLYGARARLDAGRAVPDGYTASLRIPQEMA